MRYVPGLFFGLLFGLVDATIRFFKGAEWFELYQALLIPMLVFGIVFGVISLFIKGRQLWLAGFCTWLFLEIELLYNIGQSPFNIGSYLIVVFFIVLYFFLSSVLKGHELAWIRGPAKNIVLFFSFFVIFLLVYDFVSLQIIPGQSSDDQGINVILITLDTLRSDRLGFMGYDKDTSPFLDMLSNHSLVFLDAQSTTSWTLPSHSSIFTANHAYRHGASHQNQYLSPESYTLAELLSEKGYATAAFVSGAYCKGKYGLLQGFQYKHDRLDFWEWHHTYKTFSMRRLMEFVWKPVSRVVFMNDFEVTAPEINNAVFSWLDKNHDESFFLFINYFDVHDPYDQGKEYRSLDDSSMGSSGHSVTSDSGISGYSHDEDISMMFNVKRHDVVEDELVRTASAYYDAEIRHLDDHLAQLYVKLNDLGLLDDTLVIITSDHGEEFLEHGDFRHGETLYEEVISVPLMFHGKGIQKGVVGERVSLLHLGPTILDMLDIQDEFGQDGVSLLPLINGQPTFPRYSLAELYGRPELGEPELVAVTDGTYKLISVSEDDVLSSGLYNIAQDPYEQRNILSVALAEKKVLRKQLNMMTSQLS